MDKDKFYQAVKEFLAEAVEEPGRQALEEIGEDDDLFHMGLIDSHMVIRLVIFVEETTGTEIDLAEHEFEVFYTLRGLHSVAEGIPSS
ncbi:acyl carrier protein [Streptomyces sp. NPDC000987]|uniref:acyl carrier protein n=1 Tax=Streptomyces sp. NPDC000987 TaxID=3154374 RepID=UPI003331527A